MGGGCKLVPVPGSSLSSRPPGGLLSGPHRTLPPGAHVTVPGAARGGGRRAAAQRLGRGVGAALR